MAKPRKPPCRSDFNELIKLSIDLLNRKKLTSASYIVGILKTDLAERGHPSLRKKWPIPGEPAPAGWDLYEAALDWCADGYHRGLE